MAGLQNFHLSLPCEDVEITKSYYVQKLGCSIGRSSTNWVDVDLFGNQITFTQSGSFNFGYKNYNFEQTVLPSFHFGVILPAQEWEEIYNQLKSLDLIEVEPTTFLSERKGEHTSFFIKDPNNYFVEFKTFKNSDDRFSV